MENTLKYCPKTNDNICVKFKTELEDQGIECREERAARIKQRLQWKCESGQTLNGGRQVSIDRKKQEDKLYPEHDLLPEHIRPNSYEIWLWIHKEPIVKGNVTIDVTVHK